MANEELNISKDKARLTVIGNSYPDVLTDSGFGFDIPELIVDALDELGIELPDWGPIVPPDLIIGLDPDTGIPTLEYPDPEWEEPEWPDPDIPNHDWPEPDWPDNDLPDILDYPLPELDWDDFIDKLEDLGIDPNALTDLSFVGLDDLGIPTLVSLDMDFNIREDNCPASIVIVTPPNKTEYTEGERIDLTGMVVTAKKADGSTWTSAKYPNGHIPLQELRVPQYADMSGTKEFADISDDYDEVTQEQIEKIASPESVANLFSDDFPGNLPSIGSSEIQSKFAEVSAGAPFYYAWCDGLSGVSPEGSAGHSVGGMWCGIIIPVSQSGNFLQCIRTSWDVNYAYWPKVGYSHFYLFNVHRATVTMPLYAGSYPWDNRSLKSSINADTFNVKSVDVGFTSPCLTDLTATFDISVRPKQDYDGTHHGNGGR